MNRIKKLILSWAILVAGYQPLVAPSASATILRGAPEGCALDVVEQFISIFDHVTRKEMGCVGLEFAKNESDEIIAKIMHFEVDAYSRKKGLGRKHFDVAAYKSIKQAGLNK